MTTIEKLQKFANDHGVVLDLDGEVGMGRPCVGFRHGNSYVDYNPITMGGNYDDVPGFEDRQIAESAPPDAYHKHQCLAVLVETDREKAIEQLGDWVDAMNTIGVEMIDYRTGATGIQAMITPPIGMAVRAKA